MARPVADFSIPPQATTTFVLRACHLNALLFAPICCATRRFTSPSTRAWRPTLEYTFTLKYQLQDGDNSVDDVVERLGAAGRDDALVGIGRVGRLSLEFTRGSDLGRGRSCQRPLGCEACRAYRQVDRNDISRALLIARDSPQDRRSNLAGPLKTTRTRAGLSGSTQETCLLQSAGRWSIDVSRRFA